MFIPADAFLKFVWVANLVFLLLFLGLSNLISIDFCLTVLRAGENVVLLFEFLYEMNFAFFAD